MQALPSAGSVDEMEDVPPEEVRRVMFGDPFGHRGDYSKGIFYGGRMKYLHPKKKNVNIMEPPPDFMTLKQQRNNLRLRKQGVHLVQRLEFKKQQESDESITAKGSQAKKQDVYNKKKKMIVIQKYPSSVKTDWVEEDQAGCRYWVHKASGVVTSEKPWMSDDEPDSKDIEYNYAEEAKSFQLNGTGALVYDHSEFEEFLNTLDSASKTPTKSRS